LLNSFTSKLKPERSSGIQFQTKSDSPSGNLPILAFRLGKAEPPRNARTSDFLFILLVLRTFVHWPPQCKGEGGGLHDSNLFSALPLNPASYHGHGCRRRRPATQLSDPPIDFLKHDAHQPESWNQGVNGQEAAAKEIAVADSGDLLSYSLVSLLRAEIRRNSTGAESLLFAGKVRFTFVTLGRTTCRLTPLSAG
jgi:hypothetical protein